MNRPHDRSLLTNPHSLPLYALLIGTLATFIAGYYYGRVNHIEQLPQIFRAMDSSYLRNDFAVNATAGYGPRFFYTRLLGLLGRLLPLPVVFLVLTCLQNAAVALVTFLAAHRLFDKRLWAAVAATVLVISVRSVRLGEADYLILPALIPASLITAPALLAVWYGILGMPFAAMLAALPAVLLHPLLGILCGGIGIATAGADALLAGTTGSTSRRSAIIRSLTAFGSFAVVASILWLLLPPRTHQLSTKEFFEIYARFRAPHHILPSTFPLRDWLAMLALLAAAALAGIRSYTNTFADRTLLRRIVVAVCIVLLLWLGGYLFVEIWPSRLWITAQTFRLTLLVKWLCLIIGAGLAATALENPDRGQLSPAGAGISLAGSGISQPFILLWGQTCSWLCRWLHPGLTVPLVLIIAIMLGAGIGMNIKELHALLITAIISLLFFGLKPDWRRYLISFGLGLIWVGLIILNRYTRLPVLAPLLSLSAPTFSVEELSAPEAGLAAFVRSNTPADAVFITPPDFGIFRLSARRAIIADFKFGMPSDETFLLWRQRLRDCYGEVSSQGWAAVAQMDSNWHQITDGRLLSLAKKYGASYAVLYRDTRTDLPVLYSNSRYQLVAIVPIVSLVAFRSAATPVTDASAYFEWLKTQAGISGQLGSGYYMLVDREITPAEAIGEYQSAVSQGRLPQLGRPITTITATAPDNSKTTAIFFVPED